MSKQPRNQLVNMNRLLVLIFTLTGLNMNGYKDADLPTTLALIA